jgi:hypothetical protein
MILLFEKTFINHLVRKIDILRSFSDYFMTQRFHTITQTDIFKRDLLPSCSSLEWHWRHHPTLEPPSDVAPHATVAAGISGGDNAYAFKRRKTREMLRSGIPWVEVGR